jgi:hypothetical protein
MKNKHSEGQLLQSLIYATMRTTNTAGKPKNSNQANRLYKTTTIVMPANMKEQGGKLLRTALIQTILHWLPMHGDWN